MEVSLGDYMKKESLNYLISNLLLNKLSTTRMLEKIEQTLPHDTIDDPILLYDLIKFMDDRSERDEFWDCIIFFVSPKAIDDKCFAYFLKNNISLLKLAHMQLKNKQLERLSETYDEASLTLANRLYCLEKYSISEFKAFIINCDNESTMYYLLNLGELNKEKFKLIIETINNKAVFSSQLKLYAKEIEMTVILENTNDVALIRNMYKTNNARYLLSISKNTNTPQDILMILSKISGIKFASKIRSNSLNNLYHIK
jgi:hypothetical protein